MNGVWGGVALVDDVGIARTGGNDAYVYAYDVYAYLQWLNHVCWL